MVTYKQMYSILLKDGCKYPVNITQWAETTLTGSDLAEFQNDSKEIIPFFLNLIDNGILTRTPITETVNTTNGNVTITMGWLYTWQDQKIHHAKEEVWQSRFAADPAVTYNPEVLQP